MKIVCPDCKAAAELSDDFAFVKCPKCTLDMTYGEYVRYVAYKDKRYRDILSDYKLWCFQNESTDLIWSDCDIVPDMITHL